MKIRFLSLRATLATAHSAIVRSLASRRGVALVALLGLVTVISLWRVRVALPAPTPAHDALVAELHRSGAELPVATEVVREGSPQTRLTGGALAPARVDVLAKTQAFQDWLTDWRRADDEAQSRLADAGVEVARERRTALKHLIQTDPRLALEHAVPVGLRAELPAAVRAQLETRLDARGDLDVIVGCKHDHADGAACQPNVTRTVTLDGQRYAAFVFGRRETQQTKYGLPLHGIEVDGQAAFFDTPYRWLDDGEKAARALPVEQSSLLVADRVVGISGEADLKALTARLIAAESQAGPQVIVLGEADGNPTRSAGRAALTSPTSWTLGAKRVLWVRVDYSDDPGSPCTDAEIAAASAGTSEFYATTSHGRTTMTHTTLPALLRLARTKAFFTGLSGDPLGPIGDDAKAAAKAYDAANGNTGTYDPDRYDRWIIAFRKIVTLTGGAWGVLGGAPTWLSVTDAGSSVISRAVGHELGHNQSLAHAHSWVPSTPSPIGPGTFVEYGDPFDRMGSSDLNLVFNVAQKAKIGFLDAAEVTTVATAGTYRLTRHDHKDATGVRALRVGASNVDYDFWIEHRRIGPTAATAGQLDRLQNGVLLHWGAPKLPSLVPANDDGSYLLDMTPGSVAGMNDAPLRIGETFTDPDSGITVKPLTVGGVAPNEYIDVQISLGAIDGNRNPVLAADTPAGTLNARTNLTVSVSATDPDGDPLYYRWDFGDGKLQPKVNTVTTRYLKGGAYPITVSAHDGKGGLAVKSYTLNVADPLVNWTRNATALTTARLYDVTYGAGKFVAVGDFGTIFTSPTGGTWTRATAAPNTHNYRGVAFGSNRFVAVGLGATTAVPRAAGAFSTDGVTWTAATVPAGAGQLSAVSYGAGRFVAVGETGRIYTSPDGTAWSETASPVTTLLRAVAFANGLFVAAGDGGRLVTSPDGLAWTNRSLPDSTTYSGITHHGGVWYVTSGPLWVQTSADGVTWLRQSTTGGVNLFTNKSISAAGVLLGTHSEGRLQFSEDGRTWTNVQLDASTGGVIRGIAEGGGALVALADIGFIYTTTVPALAAPRLPAPAMRLEGASLKLSVGRKNIIAAGGAGYTRLELYANGTKVSEISGASGFFTWTPPAIGSYSLAIRGIDATGASAFSAAYPAQAAFAAWSWRNPGPAGADFWGAARVDGRWWLVGGAGNVVALEGDGTFTPIDFPSGQRLTGIASANGRTTIVANVATDPNTNELVGNPWTSPDAYAWSGLNIAIAAGAYSLNHVVYAGGQWLAVGPIANTSTSGDGVTWTRRDSVVGSTLYASAYGNNLYAAVGVAGVISTSPDGVTWTARTSGVTTDLRNIAFANGTFVAAGLGGVILSSTDGATWTRRTSGTTQNLYGAGAIKGAFVVAGDNGTVLTSTDAVTWTPASIENRTSSFFGAVGADGEGLLFGRAGEVYTATTATTYKRATQGNSDARNAVIYAGGKFVAVGQAIDPLARNAAVVPVVTSSDGVTWTRATANAGFSTLNDVTYAQSRYVAVGEAGRVFTSTDAVTWTERATGSTTQRLAAGASPTLFVVAGASGSLLTSPDGSTWTARTSGTTNVLRGATFGNNRYVVVGDNGTVLQSADGTAWTAATSGTTAQLTNVSYFDNVGFLAVGASGAMLNSTDGITWRIVDTGVTDAIGAIAQTPIGFLAPIGNAGTLLMSLDGLNWVRGSIPIDRTVRGVAANASTIVAVGDSGAILTYDLVDATPAPSVAAAPRSQTANLGDTVRLSVTAQNTSGGAYQWFKDGAPIVGANVPTFTTTASASNLGSYAVAIATPTGTVTSAAAVISLAGATSFGRLINLSVLTSVAPAPDSFTMGYVVGGSATVGAKPLVIRAAGPSLGAFGVPGTLDDPKLETFAGSTKTGENDNWGGSSTLTSALAAVGAFAYTGPTSKDAALTANITTRDNSVVVSSATTTGGGTVIAELYDATPTPAFTVTTPRLINVSVRKHLGTGLTVGFVLGGSVPTKVLVRAVGPTLGVFGVPGTVDDPQLTLFNDKSVKIGENNDWGGTAELSAAFGSVGAFGLPPTSKDAAVLVTLPPGLYSVQVSGTASSTGVALVEVYEVP